MAFLKLMGVTVPVQEEGGGEVALVQQGEHGRSFTGVPFNAVRASGEEYRGRWPLVAMRTSVAYSMLVRGHGQAWRFATAGSGASADLYSSKGLAPSSVTGTPVTYASGGPVENKGYLKMPLGASASFILPPSPLNEASVSVWAAFDPMGAWTHYLTEYSTISTTPDAVWENGTMSGGFLLDYGLAVSATALTLTIEPFAMDYYFAELMVLPYRLSLLESAWADWAYNSGSGRRAENLSYLTMEGDWARTGSDTVLGEVTGSTVRTVTAGGSAASWASGSFTLRSTNTSA